MGGRGGGAANQTIVDFIVCSVEIKLVCNFVSWLFQKTLAVNVAKAFDLVFVDCFPP